MKTYKQIWPVAIIFAACSGSNAVPSARFANAPPVEMVNDQRNTKTPPRNNDRPDALFYFDGSVYRRTLRPMELPLPERARGVNALDEVPDSTWFTNRIGVRDLTLDEIRRGPNVVGNPEKFTPWTIHSKKSTGESLGFVITDSRGERFLIKFDRVGYPELETATQLIAGRILWAVGYNVSDDYIAQIRTEDLVVGADAETDLRSGVSRRFTPSDLATALQGVEHDITGKIRVMASHFVDGKPLGGHRGEGTRPDDPNDLIPHELRRDLRGAVPVFAWLDHADVKERNTLDVWVEDPRVPSRHFVVHYFLDYGKAFGGLSLLANDPRRGVEYALDPAAMYGSLITLGLRPRPYERRHYPTLRGIGPYSAADYSPAEWRPSTPSYLPFVLADRIDWFWGARIVMRFTPDQLRAIVELGELSDPAAENYLINTLIARQRETAAYAFSRVSPLDNFVVNGSAVCFDDLALAYQLSTSQTRYLVRTFDRRGRQLAASSVFDAASSHTCTAPIAISSDADGYTIVELETRRDKGGLTAYVHLARDPQTRALRVIGIWRD